MTITQEILRQKLHYNPDTGLFKWIEKPVKGGVKIGDIAGHKYTAPHNKKSYVVICINKSKYYAHRLTWLYMNGSWPENEIDHIDGNGSNNIFYNLRSVTAFDNKKNMKKSSINTSGITGVHWETRRSLWVAKITYNRSVIFLGYFDNIFDAACARKNAELKYEFHKNHGSDRPL